MSAKRKFRYSVDVDGAGSVYSVRLHFLENDNDVIESSWIELFALADFAGQKEVCEHLDLFATIAVTGIYGITDFDLGLPEGDFLKLLKLTSEYLQKTPYNPNRERESQGLSFNPDGIRSQYKFWGLTIPDEVDIMLREG